jgi:hypothetical protein
VDGAVERAQAQGVAAQVAFEKHILKPGNHFTASKVETKRFQPMGQLKAYFEASFSLYRFKI